MDEGFGGTYLCPNLNLSVSHSFTEPVLFNLTRQQDDLQLGTPYLATLKITAYNISRLVASNSTVTTFSVAIRLPR